MKLRIADIDAILMQHMYYERTIRGETVSDKGAINVTTPGLRRYYTEVNKALLEKPIELCESMIRLTKMWKTIAAYPCVQVLLKFNENAKLFLASFLYRFDENSIYEDTGELKGASYQDVFGED